jgi:hypothetical protein
MSSHSREFFSPKVENKGEPGNVSVWHCRALFRRKGTGCVVNQRSSTRQKNKAPRRHAAMQRDHGLVSCFEWRKTKMGNMKFLEIFRRPYSPKGLTLLGNQDKLMSDGSIANGFSPGHSRFGSGLPLPKVLSGFSAMPNLSFFIACSGKDLRPSAFAGVFGIAWNTC